MIEPLHPAAQVAAIVGATIIACLYLCLNRKK
jgi:hypothetical protein